MSKGLRGSYSSCTLSVPFCSHSVSTCRACVAICSSPSAPFRRLLLLIEDAEITAPITLENSTLYSMHTLSHTAQNSRGNSGSRALLRCSEACIAAFGCVPIIQGTQEVHGTCARSAGLMEGAGATLEGAFISSRRRAKMAAVAKFSSL